MWRNCSTRYQYIQMRCPHAYSVLFLFCSAYSHDIHGNLHSSRDSEPMPCMQGHTAGARGQGAHSNSAGARGPKAHTLQPAGEGQYLCSLLPTRDPEGFLRGRAKAGSRPSRGGRGQRSPLQPLCMGAAGSAQPHGGCHCTDQVCASRHSIRKCPQSSAFVTGKRNILSMVDFDPAILGTKDKSE